MRRSLSCLMLPALSGISREEGLWYIRGPPSITTTLETLRFHPPSHPPALPLSVPLSALSSTPAAQIKSYANSKSVLKSFSASTKRLCRCRRACCKAVTDNIFRLMGIIPSAAPPVPPLSSSPASILSNTASSHINRIAFLTPLGSLALPPLFQ